MTQLLEIKAIIMGLYRRFDMFINPVAKFIISLIILIRLNTFLAASPIFAKLTVNFALAALAAFLPGSWFLLLLLFIVSAHLFVLSMEATLIVTLIMLVAYFLFARLQPKYAYLIMLVPLFYGLKLVYILPLFAGLFLTPGALIPIALGVGIYSFAGYLPQLLDMQSADASLFESPTIMIDMYKYIMNSILHDKDMILTIVVFSAVILVMYFVKKIELDYIWYITIGIGALAMIVFFIVGSIVLNTQNIGIVGPIFGTVVAALLVAAMQFFRFNLDYRRAEKLQFEDDEYYYYVRTIPKVSAVKTQKEIVKIK